MLPLLLAGLAVSRFADAQAEGKRNKLLMAMQQYQRGQAQVGQGAIQGLINSETPQARATDLSKTIADRAKSLQTSVDAVQGTNPAPLAGKMSDDYKASQEKAAGVVAERTRRAIEQLSTMGAPGEEALASGIRQGRAAGVVDSTNSAIGNVGGAFRTDMRNTVPNPGLKLLGAGLTAYGGAKFAQPEQSGWAESMGTGGTYEDSAGGMQQSPFKARTKRGFSLWGR